MDRKVKSLRGETVNFDLFAIKEQMSEAPINAEIKQREKYIDIRKRRGGRKILNNMLAEDQKNASVDASEIPFEQPEEVEEEELQGAPKRKIKRKGE